MNKTAKRSRPRLQVCEMANLRSFRSQVEIGVFVADIQAIVERKWKCGFCHKWHAWITPGVIGDSE